MEITRDSLYRLRYSGNDMGNDENTYDPVVIRILLDEIRTQGMQKPLLPVFPTGESARRGRRSAWEPPFTIRKEGLCRNTCY